MSRIPDSVSFAADVGARMYGLLKDSGQLGQQRAGSGSSKMGLVRRAQEFPSLVLSIGLSPAVTFYMAKAGDGLRELGKLIGCLGGKGEGCESWEKELSREEGKGYTGYLAILVAALSRLGVAPPSNDYRGMLEAVRGLDVRRQRLLMPYIIEVKKVLEALE
ncbi:MAG: hypothetical protein ACP5LG_06495 [Conexivisphaera sp.]